MPTEHVVLASMGDLLGLKGLIVNLVVRRVKKLVPTYSLPGAVKFNAALKKGAGGTLKRAVEVGHDDVAFLQYTGGTTGVSKGATLTHHNVLANTEQSVVWFEPSLGQVEATSRPCLYLRAAALPHLRADA